MDTVGERIKAFRIYAELTQKDLADKVGMTYQQISQYENGKRKPKYETLEKLAAALDTDVDSLFFSPEELTHELESMKKTAAKLPSKKPLVNNDEELTEYLYYLKTRPELRMLFKVSSKASKADVEQAVRIIEAIRNDEKDNPPST